MENNIRRMFCFSFTSNHSLTMFFENGEQLRKVLEPIKDQVMRIKFLNEVRN
jgi:hypothetical protein